MVSGDHFVDMFGSSSSTPTPPHPQSGGKRSRASVGEVVPAPVPTSASASASASTSSSPPPSSGNRLGVARAYKEQADSRFRAGSYSDARSLYAQCVSLLSPSNPDSQLLASCHANSGACSFMLRDYAACVRDCTSCVRLDPAHFKAAARRSKALLAAGDFDGAVETMEEFAAGAGAGRPRAEAEVRTPRESQAFGVAR